MILLDYNFIKECFKDTTILLLVYKGLQRADPRYQYVLDLQKYEQRMIMVLFEALETLTNPPKRVTTEIVPYNGNFLKVTLRQPLTWDDEINSIRFQNAILTLIGFYQHQEYSLNIW